MILVVEAKLTGYFLNFHIREIKHLACLLYLQLVEIIQRAVSGFFKENLSEV